MTPQVTTLATVEGGGLRLTLDDGRRVTLRLTYGDLENVELWAESRTEATQRLAALVATMSDPDTDHAAVAAEVRAINDAMRSACQEMWHLLVADVWPDADTIPAVLGADAMHQWRLAIERDPFSRSAIAEWEVQMSRQSRSDEH